MKSKKSAYKIGLYVRVSTEEQAQNPEGSIKSQEQRLRHYIDFKNAEQNFGEVKDVFVDRAKSGKDTNRVQLQRMLKAVASRDIDMIMVTELSRLSRSIRDFSEIWDLMKLHDCGFLCLREQFDTTTAAGEMVLFTIANISQFERKQVSERVSANFLARARRGLWNGGSCPYGYQQNQDRKGYLLINEEEAKIVRIAFDAYLEEGGLAKACKSLNGRGHRMARVRVGSGGTPRHGYFTVDNLQAMLRNKSYIVQRVYQEEGESKVTKASWDPIVSEQLFNRVQNLLAKNYEDAVKLSTDGRRYPYILSNITYCGQCQRKLCGKSAHGAGGKVSYYEHSWATRRKSVSMDVEQKCQPYRIQAKIIEPLIWKDIEQVLSDEKMATHLIESAKNIHRTNGSVVESENLRQKLSGIEHQLDSLSDHLSRLPKDVPAQPIFKQMTKLDETKQALQAQLERLLNADGSPNEPASIKDYKAFQEAIKAFVGSGILSPDDKSKVVKALVKKIEVWRDSVTIHYAVGADHVKCVPKGSKKIFCSSSSISGSSPLIVGLS
jgi:site-specific DNA recombinase